MPGVSDLAYILKWDADTGRGLQVLGDRVYSYWYGEGVGETPAAFVYQIDGWRDNEGLGRTTRRCLLRCTVVIDRNLFAGPPVEGEQFSSMELTYGELRGITDVIADRWVRYRPPSTAPGSTFVEDPTFEFYVIPPVQTQFVFDDDLYPGYLVSHIDAHIEFTDDPLD